ncbi:MAG: multidrug efflux MFS transporter [Nocardioidaceae bacterium]|nr:multidrug efflux MFS transporter [Nocardioidaceae bacterium]
MTAPIEDDLSPKDYEIYDAELEAELASGRTPLVIKLLVAATFVVILNETIMVNALSKLEADFKISDSTGQWLSSIFMLTMAAVIPLTGWFLQRVSTRTAYASAMITFCVGTLLAGVAPTFGILLVGRVIQASGTAVMMPLLMTTLMTVVPMQDRGRVMGNVTLAMSVAPALGPTASGLILQVGSWRLIFFVVLPIALVVGLLGFRLLENVGEAKRSPVSWVSVVLAAAGFSSLVYGLNRVGQASWAEPTIFIAVGVVLVAVFVLNQIRLQRFGTPLLDMRAFKHATFTKSLILMAVAFMGFFGSMILIPLYLQTAVRGLSPLQAGLIVMPGGLAMGLLGPQVGRLYDRFGSRPLVIPGALGLVAMLAALSQVSITTPYWLIIVVHVALMTSLAAIFTPVFSLGLGDLPPQLYSHGSSLLGSLQQVAGAIGTALLIMISSNQAKRVVEAGLTPDHPRPSHALEAQAFVSGMEHALLVSAAISVVVVVMATLLPSRPPEGATAGHGH